MYQGRTDVKARLAKRCPFCGSDMIVTLAKGYYYHDHSQVGYCRIGCENCSVTVSDIIGHEASYSDAYKRVLKQWNRRVMA